MQTGLLTDSLSTLTRVEALETVGELGVESLPESVRCMTVLDATGVGWRSR